MHFFSALAAFAATAQAASATHVIDNSHTYPHFTYNHFGFSSRPHKLDKTRGKVVLDRAGKAGNASTQVKRSEFNMGKNAPFVSDEHRKH